MAIKLYQTALTAYPDKAKTSALSPKAGQQVKVYSATLLNRSGGAADLAMLRGFGKDHFSVFALTASLTDITAALQAGTSTTVIPATNNQGFVVESTEKFSLIGLNVSQADSGSPVYAFQYWNGAAWAALPAVSVPTAYALGESVAFFLPPADWAVGGSGLTGADANKFHVKVIGTTAPGTAVKADAIWVGQLVDFQPNVADKTAVKFMTNVPEDNVDPLTFGAGDYVLPYFGTKNAGNAVRVEFLTNY